MQTKINEDVIELFYTVIKKLLCYSFNLHCFLLPCLVTIHWLSMLDHQKDKREKRHHHMRSLVDYTMGLIYLAVGLFLLFAEKWGVDIDSLYNLPLNGFRIAFAALCIIYGAWRWYRGYKKHY